MTPRQGECFTEFLLRLRQQASKCSFGTTKIEIQEICIADKIIDAWAKATFKKKLLESELKLEEIINMCTIEEQVNQQSEAMLIQPDTKIVKKIAVQSRRQDKRQRSTPYEYQRKRPRTSQSHVHAIDEEETKSQGGQGWSNCFKVISEPGGEETVSCLVGGSHLQMIIDSGSRYNLISHGDWLRLNRKQATVFNIRTTSATQFKAYASDETLRVVNVFEAPIRVQERPEIIATFYVIENGRQSLPGRDTAVQLNVLKLGLNVNRVEAHTCFPKWKASPVRLAIDHNVRPVQQPMRRFPTALEDQIAERINQAVQQDIIEPVRGPSPWISPVVAAFKGNGEIRLCLDMRRANLAISRENHPLPTFDMFMTKLREAKYFSRLDLRNAYHQLELDESSRQITTFITHKGLFRYKRLFFGVNSAPEIFQRRLEELLVGCSNALNYIDDVIVFGKNEEEHDKALKAVLKIFDAHNVVLNEQKCVYKTNKLKFLGHILSDHGIEADPEKVKVIAGFRAPKTKEETRSFLGLVTYVGKFIPDLANTTEPLRRLIKANTTFEWSVKEQRAFDILKKQVVEVTNLSYFNKNFRTCLIADASPVALGAVLVQIDDSNVHHIVSFPKKGVPKSLTISEIMDKSMQDEEIIDTMTCLSTNSWEANASSPYYPFRWELSAVGNVLLHGTKIVIPTMLRSQVLELAHEGHPGESAMKRRLRPRSRKFCQGL
ncbi:uncharacterized protein K02A2.6-like [Drosophila mojavensis]|uniref:uncharacterized protein K02A2.6-like n=1 Tax=Drosophila mojavensis TaxID=7230 RepID=UPI001CD1170F|nr:uncharacterized protein K02A2.6-like [Drosophila mojavensis]